MKESRRKFLNKLSFSLGGLIALGASIPFLGSLFSPLVRSSTDRGDGKWMTIGPESDFPLESMTLIRFENPNPEDWSGMTKNSALYLRNDPDEGFVAFHVNCTHLGCPIRWEADSRLFFCPCHGGVFYKNGKVAAGPPSKELARYPTRVTDGIVEFQTGGVPIVNITYEVENT